MTYCPFEDDCPFPDGRCAGDPFLGEDDCPYLMDISKEEWEEEMANKNNAKKPGVSNYALACDVAGAVRNTLDQMDREEKRA